MYLHRDKTLRAMLVAQRTYSHPTGGIRVEN